MSIYFMAEMMCVMGLVDKIQFKVIAIFMGKYIKYTLCVNIEEDTEINTKC